MSNEDRSGPLAHLLRDNAQWAERVERNNPGFFEKSAQGQTPLILWIGCSDSRVPDGVVTDSLPGTIFTHRNIANQFHPDDVSAKAVLQFAVDSLHVRHVVVVGHTLCGGANASLTAVQNGYNPTLPNLPPTAPLNLWLDPLTKHVESLQLGPGVKDPLELVVEENVKWQVENICKTQTIVSAWSNPERREVQVHGWVYDLATGKLRDLGITRRAA